MKLNRRKKDQRIFSTRLNRINFIIIYSVIIFIFGMIFYQQGYVGKIKQSIRYLKSDYSFSAIRNKAESLTADIDKLVIDVNFKNYQKLAFQRELAMKIGNAYRTHELNEGYVK